MREGALIKIIDRRLRKNSSLTLFISLIRKVFNIITDQHTHLLGIVNVKIAAHLFHKLLCFYCIRFLLLREDSSDAHIILL